jgi:hypothetical protein
MTTTQENSEIQNLKQLHKKTIKIYGPPGTGKTFTLIERILKNYLRKGVPPERIAFISFTNKAVNTAIDRALSAFPQYTIENFTRFKTLHKYCRRYFKEEIFDIKNCMIDYALQESILKRSDNRLEDDEFIYKDWSLSIYDKARNMMTDPIKVYKMESYKKDNIDVFQRKIATYEHYKKDSFIDFTDMIERAIDEIDFPPLDVLILDEAQDFTPLQWSVGIYQWNGADSKYFTTYFPGRKVVLRKTRRFGEAIHHFTEIIRRGIIDSEEKEYLPSNKKGAVKRYLNFKEIDFNQEGTWYILGRVNRVVNELRMSAKEAGLYFGDNKGNKSFDRKQWTAIKAWTAISNGKIINKSEAETMYKYIRDIEKDAFRTEKFWIGEPDFKTYNFETLKEWCGLAIPDEKKNKEWWWILRRNFTSRQKIYFIRLLKRYGQKQLNEDPQIIIDTIHSVKGGEADHVVLASKNDYASDFSRKNKLDKSGERKVYYTGASRAKDTLHILSTDYKYHYPIGKDYLIYLEESRHE